MSKQCGFWKGTGETDKATDSSQWIKTPCAVCHPRTNEEVQAEAQEIKNLLESLKSNPFPACNE